MLGETILNNVLREQEEYILAFLKYSIQVGML